MTNSEKFSSCSKLSSEKPFKYSNILEHFSFLFISIFNFKGILKFRVFDIKLSLSFFKLFLVSCSPIFEIFGVKAPLLTKSEFSSFSLDLSEFKVVSSAFLFLDFFLYLYHLFH